ncbi:hypothetical protein Q8W38_05400 [Vibrio splendidus]|uniref:Restriction endonuclease n=1 Tax=Vibrio splendidus TaxID=29497 RepID=A0ABD5A6J1_VIBSP|nr:hypothetical protein [Vibrio splendidus]MDP2488756.1 hypothetical protein [Vibrio splendidus]PMO53525.1 hypothetical protein BCT08_16915 [Vibrio splendidus]
MSMTEVEKALGEYAKGYNSLWSIVNKQDSEFPSGSISPGSIAEYFAKKYLETKFPDCKVEYGKANERSWDIRVSSNNIDIRYQVKSNSLFNKSRTLSKLVKGFDQLIVISLDCDFFPYQAYLFETVDHLFTNSNYPVLTVPNPDNDKQTGSKAFKQAINIHEEFFGNLSEKL